jgi:hypothetical protein
MARESVHLAILISALFLMGSLPLMGSVSAEEIDNWPENDAWLHIELISWTANQTVEWDNNDGLPDPQFRICIEADGDNVDCINSPTWDNQWSLNNSWNYSLDIPDHSNILNITIECEDNDAFNDDECDMNSELNEWKLYAEYNWSATPTLTVTGNGDGDGNETWKNAASTWKFSIDGFGDEDGDGVSDNVDVCSGTMNGESLLNHSKFIGCSWKQLDYDADGTPNGIDPAMYDSAISINPTHSASASEWLLAGQAVTVMGVPPNIASDHRPQIIQLSSDSSEKSIKIGERVLTVSRDSPDQYSFVAKDKYRCWGGFESIQCSSGTSNQLVQYIDFNHDGLIDSLGDDGLTLQSSISDYPQDIETPGFTIDEEFTFQMEIIPVAASDYYPWSTSNSDCDDNSMYSGNAAVYDRGTPLDLNLDGLIEIWFVDAQINRDCDSPRIYAFPEESFTLKESYPPDRETVLIPIYDNLTYSDCSYQDGTESGREKGSNPIFAYEEITQHMVLVCAMSDFDGDRTKIMWTDSGQIVNEEIFYIPYDNEVDRRLFDGLGGLGDLNQDGWIDYLRSPNLNECYAYLGSTTGFDFDQGFKIGDFDCNSGIRVVDLDGDGDLDISGDYTLAFNNDGSWEYQSHFGDPSRTFWGLHAIADLDNDGDYDRVVTHYGGDGATFGIFFNPSILDDDGDSIEDQFDSCPNTGPSEVSNSQGCSTSQTDEDLDGIVDVIDKCIQTPAGVEVDGEGCSENQKDDDLDGVSNLFDECEDTPLGSVVNFLGCSTEESTDADGDGVVDSEDDCPDTPPGYPVLENGCSDEESLEEDLDGDGYSGPYSKILFVQSGDAFPLDPTQWFDEDGDGYGDNPSPANNYDACPNTKSGASVNAFGCSDEQLDSDYDGVSNAEDAFPYDQYEQYDADNDGIGDNSDQCSDSIVSNVDSTGCSKSQLDSASAGSDGDAMLGFMTCCVLPIGMVVYFSRTKKKKATKSIQYVPMNIPASRPVQRQPTQQEMHAQNMLLEKQRETNHLQQQLANQASQTQHLQQQLAQQNQTAAQMNSMQAELAALQQSKATLEKELEEAAKATTVVQNITYNIQDSAIAGDLNANLNPKSDEN